MRMDNDMSSNRIKRKINGIDSQYLWRFAQPR